MAKGEGGEQYSNASLLNKLPSSDDIKLAKKSFFPQHERRNRLSICSKLCYAIGGAPYQITGSALGFFLQIYLLDVAQMDAFYASIILFVGRAWDGITDPTVGFLVSRSPWTRFGRMLPWIALSTPLAVLCYFLIFYVPPFKDGNVVWYLFFYCAFQTLQTCFHVPYSALTMFISSEQAERDSATAYRMTVEVLGAVLGTAIQGQIVGMANTPCVPGPGGPAPNVTNLSAVDEHNASVFVLTLDHTKTAYMMASGVICFIYVLCAVVLFLGVREQKELCYLDSKPISFSQSIKLVMGHGPYVKLVTSFLFSSLAYMLLEGNFALFCTYTLGFRNDFQNILLVIMLSATLAIPFWQWFLTRFGKKTAAYCGTLAAVPSMILVVSIESNLIVTYFVSICAGMGVASAYLMSWSMLPDVVDFKLHNPKSMGHEAIFYSFYVFFSKFASGISLGISTLSLHFAGYINRGCSQPEAVDLTLKVLVSAAPICLMIVGLVILYFYPIDEKRRQRNREQLIKQCSEIDDSETDSAELAA
uniref:MFSD2 lysolipid transporter A, lysophospholipid b n=1 Tax=Tetraodon nigroviridis TaxID=99883 RepID=H3CV19_TETNG